jgi:hypothetical protein
MVEQRMLQNNWTEVKLLEWKYCKSEDIFLEYKRAAISTNKTKQR